LNELFTTFNFRNENDIWIIPKEISTTELKYDKQLLEEFLNGISSIQGIRKRKERKTTKIDSSIDDNKGKFEKKENKVYLSTQFVEDSSDDDQEALEYRQRMAGIGFGNIDDIFMERQIFQSTQGESIQSDEASLSSEDSESS
jgi:hypothetical protein